MMERAIDIIIPTWNNAQFLTPCLVSIIKTGVLNDLARVIVVNNGDQPIAEEFGRVKGILVVKPGENLGWEKGLAYGLTYSKAPFVCFQNDDTHIPQAAGNFYRNMLTGMSDPDVAAVGPVTTTAMGIQSIFHPRNPLLPTESKWLIFFCVLLRRAHLDAVGGIDADIKGGDDLDLSMRLRQAGKKLLVIPNAFLIHHGFKTGTRVHGEADTAGGWNSQQMTDRTNRGLIQKHGFKLFFDLWTPGELHAEGLTPPFLEDQVIKKMVNGQKDILELGCGDKKIFPDAVGVDWVPYGQNMRGTHEGKTCVASVVADVSKPLPFPMESQDLIIAQHILEHCLDSVQTLWNWKQVLRQGGELIIAVPDQSNASTIPMDLEHVHAFTPDSLKNLAEVVGFEQLETTPSGNNISFVSRFKKVRP